MLQIAQWLETTRIAVLVRESPYGFPVVVGTHILGLSLSVGMMLWFDLRLLGVAMRNQPVATVYRRLIPWAAAGFTSMFVTGAMLFTGYATSAIVNRSFRTKMVLILVAGLNALYYHRVTERRISDWNESSRPPLAARAAGLISIVAWASVILAGRFISYTMF